MENKLISVIVPIYKVEQHLEECIHSILSSTYQNLEIILVDDGSPDKCPQLCDAYAKIDSRIHVIHQTNQGLSAARNTGLQAATGTYITFVDSDDVISTVLYEKLLDIMLKKDADLVACEYTRNIEKLDSTCVYTEDQLHIVSGFEACLSVLTNSPLSRSFTWTDCMVWNKLYRKDKINTLFQSEAVPAEDQLFSWEYAKFCNKMVIIPKAMYFWRPNPQGITHTPSISKHVAHSIVWMTIANKTESTETSLLSHLRFRSAYYAHNTMWRLLRSNRENEYVEYFKQAKQTVKRYSKELLQHNDIEFRVKLLVFLFLYCYPIWKSVAKFHRKLRRII